MSCSEEKVALFGIQMFAIFSLFVNLTACVSVSLPTKHRPHAEDLQFNQLLDPVRSGLALIRF